jgi:release factor glutamine methyltransferase
MNLRDTLNDAILAFTNAGLPGPHLDAEILLAHCLKKERLFLFTHPSHELTDQEVETYRQLVDRRLSREPVAYILGVKEFWSLPLHVDNRVLIPRPETEILVEEALKLVVVGDHVPARILDVGVGSGAISIALASELKNVHIVAADISQGAIAVALSNTRRLCLEDRISFVVGDMVNPFSGIWDMIVSNPPYIAAADFDLLPTDVRGFEPRSALLGGPTGLSFHHKLVTEGGAQLRRGGWLLMEIGAGQKRQIEGLIRMSGLYDEICFRADYNGIDRVAAARRY